MDKREYDRLMNYNVSSIFTFLLKHRDIYLKIKDNFKNSYSYNILDIENKGNFKDDYLYFQFLYNEECDTLLDKIDYLEKRYVGEYVILKVNKFDYMSKREWELLKLSNYYEFKDLILENSRSINKGNNLQYFIINKIPVLLKEISEYIGHDISQENIAWKAFSFEEECLDLSKINDMTILGYKRSWITEQMKKANFIEREIYQNVLNNSFEITAPKEIALGKNINNLSKNISIEQLQTLYSELETTLKEKCGKKQFNLIIKGTKYPFFPNEKDFLNKLSKVIKKYNLDEIDKIKKCLINHINTLREPQLKYYIEKNNESRLVDDYRCIDDTEEVKEIIDPKTLF